MKFTSCLDANFWQDYLFDNGQINDLRWMLQFGHLEVEMKADKYTDGIHNYYLIVGNITGINSS